MGNIYINAIRFSRGVLVIPSIFTRNTAKIISLFLIYLGTARIGTFLFQATNNGPALIWPPAGIGIAALYLWGYKYWPVITIASLVNSSISGSDYFLSSASAVGHTLQVLAGAYFLNRLGFDRNISRLRDMLALFAVAFFATAIAPTPSLIVRFLFYDLDSAFILGRWVTVWLGCMLSVIVVTPFITSWFAPLKILNKRRFIEGFLVFAILITLESLLFWSGITSVGGVSLFYAMMIPLFWLSIRFSPKIVTLGILLTTAIFVSGLFFGHTRVPTEELSSRLMQIEILVIFISAIFYLLSAVSEEKKIVNEALQGHIGKLEKALETIKHHALHDVLTDLLNRNAMEERFIQARSLAISHEGKLALLFLDLDQFKNINDTLGHNVGDRVLKVTAERLKSIVSDVDIVARLGGDEFIIILSEVYSEADIEKVAKKILQSFLNEPILIEDHSIQTTTSMGIAVFPDAGDDIDSLLKSADIALYRAKEQGRNRYQFYDLEMKNSLHAKLALEQDLKLAISNREFKLLYQPIMNLKSGKIVSAEALIRWNHPKFGLLSPDDFIPLAEETGWIIPIGQWVIDSACRQVKETQKSGILVPVSINLSSKQFYANDLVDSISETLRKYRLPTSSLELEITETVAMQPTLRTNAQLEQLVKMGVSITMDDFGTGYSSLSYLKGLYIHKLKIDKSFVKDMVRNQHDATIIRTIISMGHTLGLKVCAEGIESTEQKMLLNSMGCDTGQGYLLCKPVEAQEFVKLVEMEKVGI